MSWLGTFLVTKLAPSLAKATVKVWLKDRAVAQDVTSDLVGLLGQKTEDALARKRGARVFEDIGERVALSLQGHFREFTKKQVMLAARIAVDTFNRAEITPELLVQQNLDPVDLADHLIANVEPALELKERAQTLYRRIITEACQQIVDIASSLPGFTERSFSAVLQREDEIKEVVAQILADVEHLQEIVKKQSPEAKAARFEADYRRAVARSLDSVEIFGIDVSRTSKRQKLSVAYISLSVEQGAEAVESGEARARGAKKAEDEDEATEVVSVERALARSKRILIRGEAGSGKTTLLKWIAVQAAQTRFGKDLDEWNGTAPFFIRLRQCSAEGLPAPEVFPELVAASIAGEAPHGWVHECLRSGSAVVLVDGVDEVPQARREQVRVWLRDLVSNFPESRYIITSRPHAVEQGWITEDLFEEAELQPMDLPEISSFIDHWHKAVCESLEDQEEITELPALKESLKEAVRDPSKPIRRLATSPLLCAMICAMHRDRRRQLPDDRIELYEAGCQMLLERRDIERGVLLREYPTLKYRQKRLLLDELAYWMIKNDVSEVDLDRVSERFSQRLPNMSDVHKDVAGEDVVRLFVERSGIVREPVRGRLDFAHRTFQEYMAARNALDEDDLGLLVRNAHNDQWREVIILAVGQATPKQREMLILGLIKRGGKERGCRHQLYLLAVACLEVTVELSPPVKAKVIGRMKQIVPPKTLTEAKQLANAGELAVPLLRYSPNLARTTSACVRTLALIGTDSAI
ncbi:MAG: NACHT domain-containing protein, partial [Planctomycetota bacterium]